MGTGNGRLRWARETSPNSSTACLVLLFTGGQYSAHCKCAGKDCSLIFLQTDSHTSVYVLQSVMPNRNLNRSLHRLSSPGFKQSGFIKEIKKNDDEENPALGELISVLEGVTGAVVLQVKQVMVNHAKIYLRKKSPGKGRDLVTVSVTGWESQILWMQPMGRGA